MALRRHEVNHTLRIQSVCRQGIERPVYLPHVEPVRAWCCWGYHLSLISLSNTQHGRLKIRGHALPEAHHRGQAVRSTRRWECRQWLPVSKRLDVANGFGGSKGQRGVAESPAELPSRNAQTGLQRIRLRPEIPCGGFGCNGFHTTCTLQAFPFGLEAVASRQGKLF